MKYTSAEAGKLVKKIEERLRRIMTTESKKAIFNVASGEDAESLRPEYDFGKTQDEIEKLQEQLREVKHAINTFNATHTLPGFDDITIDQALIFIPQLKQRRDKFQSMLNRLPKERVETSFVRTAVIDYTISNYDFAAVEKKYKEYEDKLAAMQLALDTINSTERIEINVVIE